MQTVTITIDDKMCIYCGVCENMMPTVFKQYDLPGVTNITYKGVEGKKRMGKIDVTVDGLSAVEDPLNHLEAVCQMCPMNCITYKE
jgi:ferredoxin